MKIKVLLTGRLFIKSFQYPLPVRSDVALYMYLFLWIIRKFTSLSLYFLVADWFHATRAFEVIGILLSLAAVIFLVLYTCVPKTSGSKIVAILTAITLFGAGKNVSIS